MISKPGVCARGGNSTSGAAGEPYESTGKVNAGTTDTSKIDSSEAHADAKGHCIMTRAYVVRRVVRTRTRDSRRTFRAQTHHTNTLERRASILDASLDSRASGYAEGRNENDRLKGGRQGAARTPNASAEWAEKLSHPRPRPTQFGIASLSGLKHASLLVPPWVIRNALPCLRMRSTVSR